MSKSDQNAAKSQAQGQIATNNTNETAVNQTATGVLNTAQGTAANLLPSITGGYQDIASTGGYDPNIAGTINTTFGNLATTGGVSDADALSMQNRAAEAAKSTYQTGQDAAARSSAATGGYGATGGAIQANLARQGSQAAATAVEDTNASITGLKQSGMVAGAQGLASTQQNQAANKLSATAGLTNIYGMNESQVSTTVSQILQNYQQTGQLNNQDLTILTNLANQPGVFDKIVSTIGTLGGAAAGVLSGIGDMNASKTSTSGCWVAEAIYGSDDLRTHLLREYLNSEFKQTLKGKIIMFFYLRTGKFVATLVKRSNKVQKFFKFFFDQALYN